MKLFGRDLDGVLFDLDGTLIDSAPDLADAMSRLCAELGAPPPPDADAFCQSISKGRLAMMRRGLPHLDEEARVALVPRFLDLYAAEIFVHTRPYAGVERMLDAIELRGGRWGIVTNKPGWLAAPVVDRLGWTARCAALVSGDTLAVRKPDPASVLHACVIAGLDPARCIYVGDARHDIEAGRAAGMLTVAVSWGYLDGEDPAAWGADLVVHSAAELAEALSLAAA